MKKKFTDDQIIAILKEAQQGELSTEELCRKHGCSTASFYNWKKKFGDTSSDQAKLVRRLQRENERLTRGPATVRAGSHEGCPGKKAVTTGQKREAAQQLHHKGLTQKRSCNWRVCLLPASTTSQGRLTSLSSRPVSVIWPWNIQPVDTALFTNCSAVKGGKLVANVCTASGSKKT